jgi:hypothetical protein
MLGFNRSQNNDIVKDWMNLAIILIIPKIKLLIAQEKEF